VYDQACMCNFRHGEDYWDVTPANRHIVYTLQEDDDDPDEFNLAMQYSTWDVFRNCFYLYGSSHPSPTIGF
jgi:hypothetical protein